MQSDEVCWVEFEPDVTDDPAVAKAYRAVAGANGVVSNLYKAMALSPHAIEPADQLYRQLLHNEDCPFEPWLRELLAVQVALVCKCDYAARNHGRNFHDFFGEPAESGRMLDAVRCGTWAQELEDGQLVAMLDFGDKLTRQPQDMTQDDVVKLRNSGLSDKQIVYLAQIVASFAYWCRIINAIGISTGSEPVGLSGWGERLD